MKEKEIKEGGGGVKMMVANIKPEALMVHARPRFIRGPKTFQASLSKLAHDD